VAVNVLSLALLDSSFDESEITVTPIEDSYNMLFDKVPRNRQIPANQRITEHCFGCQQHQTVTAREVPRPSVTYKIVI
jgi:hypothetical protein